MSTNDRILLVDLNNFARYPTVSIGYITSILRRAGIAVDVLSPLSNGVGGVIRERRPAPWQAIVDRLKYRSAVSRSALLRAVRRRFARRQLSHLVRESRTVVEEFRRRLDGSYSAVLVSTYLMYRDLCARICQIAKERGTPVVLGGPYFSQPETAHEWTHLPGLTALFGGEVESVLVDLVRAVATGRDASTVPGVWNGGGHTAPAPPLGHLDVLPFPDYSDFPWERYPDRIVPIITSRGCGWGRCTFCSDITSSAGRTFRSRSLPNVVAELRHHASSLNADKFVFTDLKLNSNLDVWTGLATRFQDEVPGATWVASVHVGKDATACGLDEGTLNSARANGLVRLTTGLESGSQRMLDLMRKGTTVGSLERFARNTAGAGISLRATMILGYPSETAADVDASTSFLLRNSASIERVLLNRFSLMTGTLVHRAWEESPEEYPDVVDATPRHRDAVVDHSFAPAGNREYLRAVGRLLDAVHHINRGELGPAARPFEGVM